MSTTVDLSFVTRHNAQRLWPISTIVYIPRPNVYSYRLLGSITIIPTMRGITNLNKIAIHSYFNG